MLKQNEALTRAEIIQKIYKELPVDSKVRRYYDLVPIINSVFDIIEDAILDKREISLRGLFTIKPVTKKARMVMDFDTKTPVPFDEQKTVKIILSKKILDSLNNS